MEKNPSEKKNNIAKRVGIPLPTLNLITSKKKEIRAHAGISMKLLQKRGKLVKYLFTALWKEYHRLGTSRPVLQIFLRMEIFGERRRLK
ncbi:hypothetical protein NPIL_401941 [Nephila pilipes]|uniref:Uncharacterized protein n=1 Tax=Nephila pilipes TaxID=299642 RepID=A0A8X6QLF5_NEPPI|nr:hypothetical protein NPIL_401941 [Nephila pilipes]